MKITKHFHIEELVHPEYIERYGAKKMIKVMRDYGYATPMLDGLERLREFFDESIIVNDYKFGGSFVDSGLRFRGESIGGSLSAHMWMLATDCKIKGKSIKDAQEDILMNAHSHPNIVRMEDYRDTPSWLHCQYGYRKPNEQIKIFRP